MLPTTLQCLIVMIATAIMLSDSIRGRAGG
jgi:hypothetical protein